MIKFWIPKHVREARKREHEEFLKSPGGAGHGEMLPLCRTEIIEENITMAICIPIGLFILILAMLIGGPIVLLIYLIEQIRGK
jgi:hypothetical protein